MVWTIALDCKRGSERALILISLMLCKVTKLFAVKQIIIAPKQRYTTLFNIIQCYTKDFGKIIRKSRLFFVPLQYKTTTNTIYGINKNLWSNRACSALFPQHPAMQCLAETKSTDAGHPCAFWPCKAETTIVFTSRSKHYLPTLRAPLKAPFLGPFRTLGLYFD